ncbi:MAG: hypothetical protein M5U19_16530 [Microthrixaceae bacterium]|nr:hypothetical protein [Microthrixaceae bacterium]
MRVLLADDHQILRDGVRKGSRLQARPSWARPTTVRRPSRWPGRRHRTSC